MGGGNKEGGVEAAAQVCRELLTVQLGWGRCGPVWGLRQTELSDAGNMKMFVLSNENNGRV